MSAALEEGINNEQIETQLRDLRNVLDPSDVDKTTDMSYVLRQLHNLRQKEPSERFHLLVDQDINPGNDTPFGSQLRIVYSPMLCMSDPRQSQLIQTIAGLMG